MEAQDRGRQAIVDAMERELRARGCDDEHIGKALTFLDWCLHQPEENWCVITKEAD